MHKRPFAVGLLTAVTASLISGVAVAENTADDSAKLEIRQYRFQPHRNRGFERLVLEFTRKDGNENVQPKISVTRTGKDATILLDRAMLMGAIPESLINDSYTNKSHLLGPLTVNDDNPASGFSLRASTKSAGAMISALWLNNPPRLVIDAKTKGRKTASDDDDSAPNAHQRTIASAFDKYICFPENARVGMNVVFQPRNKRQEELRNVHINLDGTAATDSSPPVSDSIVCYPKSAQVVASLGFETPSPTDQDGGEATQTKADGAPATKGGTTATAGDDMMLLPPGAQPVDGASRALATGPNPAPLVPPPPVAPSAPAKPPTSPASLLPPLR